jgi:hypothetical protein
VLALAFPLAGVAQLAVDAELARVYDDNLSRAQRESDVQRDRAWRARAALGRGFAIGETDATLRAELLGERYDRFSGLDVAALGIGALLQRKLGLGLTAPRVELQASYHAEEHSERVRDGTRASLSVSLGKRFDERLAVSLRAAYDRREQRQDFGVVPGIPGRPFSLQGRSLAAEGSWALGERALLYGALALRHGDVVSSTRRNFEIFRASADIAPDPAFGPDFIAYRLTGARTRSWSVGLSWALGRHASVDAALARDVTRAGSGLDYDGNLYSLSLVYR